ncbi:MAG: transketolase [Propionibacteriaceae bacterium]|nr:transketolase [Propionibacteriaceae bacterium]
MNALSAWSREADLRSISTLRSLSVDQVQAAGIGHIGLPLAAAPVLHTLYSKFLVSDPREPNWVNRDRFVMSAGHGSALVYAVLHLAGYDLTLTDLKEFRRWGSRTPGHPERDVTPGVDASTGPLGQGIANAVGMAIAETMAAARLNTPQAQVIDHRTWALVSDGDLMEGVALESIALAGVLKLGKLTAYYDDNDIVIDGRASTTHDADAVCAAVAAYGWHVSEPIDAEDLEGLESATRAALADDRPSLIRVRSIIGIGSRLADTSAIHSGAVPADEADHIKRGLGEGFEAPFFVPGDVTRSWESFADRGGAARAAWLDAVARLADDAPEKADALARWSGGRQRVDVRDLGLAVPDRPQAIRQTSGTVLAAVAGALDNLVGGSADLASATMTVIPGGGTYSPANRAGRNIAYGIREHAMGAISNGIAQHGLFRPFASTFMVFASYEANALRMAALQNLPVLQVLSHDSIAVGEDGPTHQPIEQLAMLRAIPNMLVLRPADAEETVECWQAALDRCDGPSTLLVSRGPVPELDHTRQLGSIGRGGYVLEPAVNPDIVLVASGTEVSLAVEASRLLGARGVAAQVVSVPCQEVFLQQDPGYRDSILPPESPRLVVEAAHPLSGYMLAGPLGAVHGVDRFGASAAPGVILEEYGFTPSAIADAAMTLVAGRKKESVS